MSDFQARLKSHPKCGPLPAAGLLARDYADEHTRRQRGVQPAKGLWAMTVESSNRMTETHKGAQRREIPTNGPPEGGRGTDDGPAAPAAGLTPTRVLVALGAIGSVLFLAVAALLGLLQPGYD